MQRVRCVCVCVCECGACVGYVNLCLFVCCASRLFIYVFICLFGFVFGICIRPPPHYFISYANIENRKCVLIGSENASNHISLTFCSIALLFFSLLFSLILCINYEHLDTELGFGVRWSLGIVAKSLEHLQVENWLFPAASLQMPSKYSYKWLW